VLLATADSHFDGGIQRASVKFRSIPL
jgi:hypothetical protein